MISYTQKIRSEIIGKLPAAACCRRSLLAGLLVNAETGIGGTVYVRLSGKETVGLASALLSEIYGRCADPEYVSSYGRVCAEFIVDSPKLTKLLSGLSDPDRISETPDFFKCRNCSRAFTGGVVLACASFSDPVKEARAEIRIKDPARASKLTEILSRDGIFPCMSSRRGDTALLLRTAEGVEGLAAAAGAPVCAMELMQYGLMRGYKRELQRQSNCELKNLGTAAKASAAQLKAIAYLRESGKFGMLSDELRATAELRERNPDASMTELAAMHAPPISKSGLNHRMEKIIRFANDQQV
ncbi:MAG: DNA-binding protein WhiA [Clostridia bacterium]|nr:DNA-binding protein WhiA [Clostridia bacterium]